MIKPVPRSSDEHRIYEILSISSMSARDGAFSGVLPAIDILEYDSELVLVVMPRYVHAVPDVSPSQCSIFRWGINPFMPWFDTNQEVIHAMRCVLKVTTFSLTKSRN